MDELQRLLRLCREREPDLQLRVDGIPAPQGSMKAFAFKTPTGLRAAVTHDNPPKLLNWRNMVSVTAIKAGRSASFVEADSAVAIELLFWFNRPKSHYLPANSRRPKPELRPNAPAIALAEPDLDKLERAVLDAIKGTVIRDDRLSGIVWKGKFYTEGTPGLDFSLWKLTVDLFKRT